MSLNPHWVELGVCGTSVLSRTLTKCINIRFIPSPTKLWQEEGPQNRFAVASHNSVSGKYCSELKSARPQHRLTMLQPAP